MRTRTRTLIAAIVAAGVLPTAGLALAAATESPGSGPSDQGGATARMGSMMEGTDMGAMMQDMPVGRMHQHMRDMGVDIGQMHRRMQVGGMDVAVMHQMHQPGDATDDRE